MRKSNRIYVRITPQMTDDLHKLRKTLALPTLSSSARQTLRAGLEALLDRPSMLHRSELLHIRIDLHRVAAMLSRVPEADQGRLTEVLTQLQPLLARLDKTV
ncbi:protein of unknown function [Magnetospirillum gryphiswaldense MSR-1 v2]|uniref:Uncharacterized protein n=1 Tax=Magnetospirillum gryphiswaldense (strain DSM 6361 / JCM 21280 / NBRC 15271 / MSR-1) TaxID=431944 RepID=V6F046_MAGGM|nr:hypothetical protein [Magnetospirillum gryphiswaldense]CDK97853.1 protein of unknown function [Magnetospirillum gryphiswaldense MSR-1 v2]